MNRTQFFKALTHNGPGYDVEASEVDTWAESRSSARRFLHALAHSGPGYAPPSPGEIAEIKRAAEKTVKDLKLVLLEGIEKALYAKGHLEAAAKASDPQVCKEQTVLARDALGDFLHHLQVDVAVALSGVRETVSPLDIQTRFMLFRTERALRGLLSEVAPFVQSLSNAEKRPGAFENRSPLGTREVKRSIEAFSHLAAAR
ncbi:hypothetical protein ND808_41010 [Streptomyces sp. DR7-3]|uniref:hypothetical protein n=1 Tax=Streptomyces malaysiensis TaxID=92644 RepID=UPI0020435C57|nr:hypothetical protein [Streptomyces sp. DR7-3]MCM3812136.1 hypothetical protein [Streptomyces sp. DR7-3]